MWQNFFIMFWLTKFSFRLSLNALVETTSTAIKWRRSTLSIQFIWHYCDIPTFCFELTYQILSGSPTIHSSHIAPYPTISDLASVKLSLIELKKKNFKNRKLNVIISIFGCHVRQTAMKIILNFRFINSKL